LLIGFIDRASEIGQDYDAHKAKNVFYRDVTFHPVDEIGRMPRDAGLLAHAWRQTLTRPLAEATDFEPLRPGAARRSRGAQAQMIRWRAPSSGRIAA